MAEQYGRSDHDFHDSQNQVFEGAQDAIYNGQKEKWAKLANSLKLKIAARLISQNRQKAIQIAEQVANASCGVLNGTDDDFLFNKATYNSSNQDKTYHWNNGILQSVGGSKTLIDFMVNNRDLRVRFVFQKMNGIPMSYSYSSMLASRHKFLTISWRASIIQ